MNRINTDIYNNFSSYNPQQLFMKNRVKPETVNISDNSFEKILEQCMVSDNIE